MKTNLGGPNLGLSINTILPFLGGNLGLIIPPLSRALGAYPARMSIILTAIKVR